MRNTLTAVCFVLAISLAAPVAAQSPQELFQRALTLERSSGKLDSAIALYRRVVAQAGPNRSLAARALIQLGSAYEVLGRTEARSAYERVLRDFADQPALVGQARLRIAALNAPAGSNGSLVRAPSARQVWSGADVLAAGKPSPDRRFMSYTDWETGDLAIHDLITGKNRSLTRIGSLASSESGAYAETPTAFSPDSRQIAYTWWTGRGTYGDRTKGSGFELRTVGVNGGEPRVIPTSNVKYAEPWAWTPDGGGILAGIEAFTGGGYLGVISLTGETRRLATLDWRGQRNISLSPDGQWIVYDAFPDADSKQRDIYIIATDGSHGDILVRHTAND